MRIKMTEKVILQTLWSRHVANISGYKHIYGHKIWLKDIEFNRKMIYEMINGSINAEAINFTAFQTNLRIWSNFIAEIFQMESNCTITLTLHILNFYRILDAVDPLTVMIEFLKQVGFKS